jgi:hypothetical protein
MAQMSAAFEDSTKVSWQEAVACLTRERTLAETSARVLKELGTKAEIAAGSLAYGGAKAEYDAIISGLTVALAQKDSPESLPSLEARLSQGFQRRQAFCRSVQHLLPKKEAGARSWIADAIEGAINPIIDALKAIWLRSKDDDALMRKTIATQLEAAVWKDFAAIGGTTR